MAVEILTAAELSELAQQADAAEQRRKQRSLNALHIAPFSFKPGASGNPSGRPKGRRSPTAQLAAMITGNTLEGEKLRDAIAKRIIREAIVSADVNFMRLLLDRVDGPVIQHHKVEQAQTLQESLAEIVDATEVRPDAAQEARQ